MSSQFLLVFFSVIFLTILCGGAELYLTVAYGTQMSSLLADYLQKLSFLFTAGAAAIIALLNKL